MIANDNEYIDGDGDYDEIDESGGTHWIPVELSLHLPISRAYHYYTLLLSGRKYYLATGLTSYHSMNLTPCLSLWPSLSIYPDLELYH